ncbi:hypothetical protein R3P38DRAFT_3496323 [Favolaschia claudopus]|uniref:CDC48 N-terminal subdomain domain-containing protein n=1 Tax=Favolaschia claudopus TaxID=2862362 RepID=A0AAW0C348_9AGAR
MATANLFPNDFAPSFPDVHLTNGLQIMSKFPRHVRQLAEDFAYPQKLSGRCHIIGRIHIVGKPIDSLTSTTGVYRMCLTVSSAALQPTTPFTPNRLLVDETATDDNSVATRNPNTMEVLRGKKRRNTVLICLSSDDVEEGRVQLNKVARSNLRVKLGDLVGIHPAVRRLGRGFDWV